MEGDPRCSRTTTTCLCPYSACGRHNRFSVLSELRQLASRGTGITPRSDVLRRYSHCEGSRSRRITSALSAFTRGYHPGATDTPPINRQNLKEGVRRSAFAAVIYIEDACMSRGHARICAV